MRKLTTMLLLGACAAVAQAATFDSILPAIGDPGCLPPAVESTEEAAPRWVGPDGEALPFIDDRQALDFLRNADIVSAKPIGKGINKPVKLLLERDGIKAHAIFRRVNLYVPTYSPPGRRLVTARDNFRFEPAAYELGRMLGIHNIPPVVERSFDGRKGTIQLWIENAIDEQKRRERGLESPYPDRWARAQNVRKVFDALIHNIDRNQGNILYDPAWNVWLIDHTRTFVAETELAIRKRIVRCDRDFFQRLKTVDRQAAAAKLDPYLTHPELRALMVRWQKLVDHIQGLIDRRGEPAVLF